MKISLPAGKDREIELKPEEVLCNDIVLPGEFNPHNTRLWAINNEYGYLGAVWAQNEQDALDELVDADLGAGLLLDPEDVKKMDDEERDELSYLGNAGEPADLQYAGITEIKWKPERDWKLLCMFAEARGKGCDTLADF